MYWQRLRVNSLQQYGGLFLRSCVPVAAYQASSVTLLQRSILRVSTKQIGRWRQTFTARLPRTVWSLSVFRLARRTEYLQYYQRLGRTSKYDRELSTSSWSSTEDDDYSTGVPWV